MTLPLNLGCPLQLHLAFFNCTVNLYHIVYTRSRLKTFLHDDLGTVQESGGQGNFCQVSRKLFMAECT